MRALIASFSEYVEVMLQLHLLRNYSPRHVLAATSTFIWMLSILMTAIWHVLEDTLAFGANIKA